MCNNCNQNKCGGCTQVTHICNQCPTTEPCDCPILDFSTDCSTFTNDDIECDSVVVVAKNTILSDALSSIVSWSCTKFEELANYLRLINTGTGASIYSGDNLIGEKKLRKINSTSPIITVTQNTDDISVGIDNASLDSFIEANQKTYSVSNSGTGAQVYKDSTVVSNNTQFNFRKLKSSDSSVTILEGINEIDITVVTGSIPDGSETKVTAGTNVSVTGTGTIATPYVINSTDTNTTYSAGTALSLVGTTFNNTAPDQTVVLAQGGATTITGTYPNFTISSTNTIADGSETKIAAGTNITITGVGTTGTPYVVNATTPDGSETKINSGVTTAVTGTGTTGSPYVTELVNLQKVITYPADFTGTNYTLTNADNNYEIIINNGTTACTITVPAGLTSKIGVGFTQKGTGDVTYTASGTTINNPIGLKIKGQYYQTFLSQELATNNFFLGGNTKNI